MRDLVVWTVLSLAACGSSPDEPDPTDPTDPTTDPPVTSDTGDTDVTTDTGTVPTVDADWEAFAAMRASYLTDLGVPILACVARQDTEHPVFHGCYDWHSAVHGTWALLALYRLTGDDPYRAAAEAALVLPGALDEELADLQGGLLDGENPYGLAWMLLLARERETTTGATDLVPLADEAYAQLAQFVDGLGPQQVRQLVLADEYSNLSWALLQLWQQAVWTGDVAGEAHWADFARVHLLPLDAQCALSDDGGSTGFFPPCLHRALALTTILPDDEVQAWLAAYLPPGPVLIPRTSFPFLHQAGQNFSRSWGFWALWSATGDPVWRDQYTGHIRTHGAQPAYWAQNYDFYSHWVAQFGVYGIAASYD